MTSIQFEKPKRLYLIRHGHTEWLDELDEAESDHEDARVLSVRGVEQAELTAAILQEHVHFDAIYSSALSRAQDTAMLLSAPQVTSLFCVDEHLNEFPLGLGAKASSESVLNAYIKLAQRLQTQPLEEVMFTPEASFQHKLNNYLNALETILNSDASTIAVVAHAGTNLILLCYFMGIPYHHLLAFYQDHCCVNIIDCYPPQHYVIRQINHTYWDIAKQQHPIN